MSHPYVKSRNYTCSYGGLDDEGKPHVTNLQRFEEMVLEDLYAAITTGMTLSVTFYRCFWCFCTVVPPITVPLLGVTRVSVCVCPQNSRRHPSR
jgi:hypothetical protein